LWNSTKKAEIPLFTPKNGLSAFYPHSAFRKIQKYSMEFRPWNPLFTPIPISSKNSIKNGSNRPKMVINLLRRAIG
jgi:hypothetical protein